MYFGNNNNYLNIYFKENFFKDFNEINFVANESISYYDNNHLNYIFSSEKDEIKYTFNGFFKDNFLVITVNSYNEKLETSKNHKEVFLFKFKWILKKISENLSLWIIDIPPYKQISTEYFVLKNRQNLFEETIISIDDLLKINNYTVNSCEVKYEEEICKKKTKINKSTLLNFIPLLFLFKYSKK